jgi:hypothetical protein
VDVNQPIPGKPFEPTPCEHGALPGKCDVDGCLYRREVKNALLGLAGSMAAASDQAEAMTRRLPTASSRKTANRSRR